MRKFRKLAALCAVFLIALCFFSTAAYAAPEDESTSTPAETSPPAESAASSDNVIDTVLPPGTGKVVDVFEGENGRKFYTIQTPAGNTFYLIIDFTMTGENVYFLDAVQEKDLLALAEKAANGQTGTNGSVTPNASNNNISEQPGNNQTETPAQPNSSNNFTILLVVLVVLIGGGAGYYFKVYRKKRDNDSREEYEADEPEDYAGDDYETEPEDDSVPWEEDEEDV